MTLSGQELVLHAMSQTRFYATTTDVQIEFKNDGAKRDISYNVGED
jgi:hypothetical protein